MRVGGLVTKPVARRALRVGKIVTNCRSASGCPIYANLRAFPTEFSQANISHTSGIYLPLGATLLSDVGERTISFAGEVTISNIGEAHKQLGSLMREQGGVVVAIEDLTETDLTFVQLLESARRKASENGVGLSLNTPAAGSLLEVLRRGGFLDDETSDRAQFWLQGAA